MESQVIPEQEVPKKVEGYIIESEPGQYLTKERFWYRHEESEGEKPYVHPAETLEDIRKSASEWKFKPREIYPATYNPQTAPKIEGEASEF